MVLKRRDWFIIASVMMVLVAVVLNVSFSVEWAGYIFLVILIFPVIELWSLWLVSKEHRRQIEEMEDSQR